MSDSSDFDVGLAIITTFILTAIFGSVIWDGLTVSGNRYDELEEDFCTLALETRADTVGLIMERPECLDHFDRRAVR